MFGKTLLSTQGEKIEIVHPGNHNHDAGPDFSAAVIRSGDTEWGGNVEIHVKASDWKRHGHNTDKAYDTVILHVVGVDDAEVCRTDGSKILQAEVAPPAEFFNRYVLLTEKLDTPSCLDELDLIPPLNRLDWTSSLGMERLHQKAGYMKEILSASNGDWQQTVFIILSRALGFGLNGEPFELLAKSLPLNFVMRHRDNILQVEALVFGQAGMLDPSEYSYDAYYQALCKEYQFLSQKYNLKPIKRELWKYSRIRPGNFPHRRLGILSAMLCDGMQLSTRILEAQGDYDILMECLDYSASEYWKSHSRFGTAESDIPLTANLSKSSREIILINVMAPYYLAYGSSTGNIDLAEKGIDLLVQLPPEKNSKVNLWVRHGLQCKSAFDSQALLQLSKNYCDRNRCLECRFGHFLLRRSFYNLQ